MRDQSHADRHDLIRIIHEQQDRIADLERHMTRQGGPNASTRSMPAATSSPPLNSK